MAESAVVRFRLNGVDQMVEEPVNTVLIDLLRDRFGLRGVKASCERGVCGSCTALVDGLPAASCSVFAFEIDGATVETVEGLAAAEGEGGGLSPVQQAFVDEGGFQCGYCTPGMVLLATALLRRQPQPDADTIRSWISSNICRCTGYQMILDSVAQAALRRPGQGGVS